MYRRTAAATAGSVAVAKKITVVIIAELVIMMLLLIPSALTGYADAEEDNDSNLTVEVVEEIPATDIEEQAVPLAAGPDSASRDGVRHACLMGIVLILTILYAAYFSSYEKRLVALRAQAARAEAASRARRKSGQ